LSSKLIAGLRVLEVRQMLRQGLSHRGGSVLSSNVVDIRYQLIIIWEVIIIECAALPNFGKYMNDWKELVRVKTRRFTGI
jgi:hypothetical protein